MTSPHMSTSGSWSWNGTTTPGPPIDPPVGKCNYYVKNGSDVVIFEFAKHYGGIPQNTLFNLIGYVALLLLFTIIRRLAGNYGRLALDNHSGHNEEEVLVDNEASWTGFFFGAPDEFNDDDEHVNNNSSSNSKKENEGDEEEYRGHVHVDKGYLHWIVAIFRLGDDDFAKKCGVDAVQYIRFQRHLILFTLIMTIVCMAVVLPLNFQGDIQGTTVDFGHTTISNLKGSDRRLWVHVVVTLLLLPLGVIIMRRFSATLRSSADIDETMTSSRTLMLSKIPKKYCSRDLILRHLHEAYSDIEVDDVQIAHDVSKLTQLDRRRQDAQRARVYCEVHDNRYGRGTQMRPVPCGIWWCCLQSCCKSVDSLTFYQREERYLAEAVERERLHVRSKAIGIAFVTFKTVRDARLVLKDIQTNALPCIQLQSNLASSSSLANMLKTRRWEATVAPAVADIYWENLHEAKTWFHLKAVLINLFMLLLLFFFTSPAYIISQMELIFNLRNATTNTKINDFMPTLVLWTLSALIPILVAYSDWWMGHWRRSMENLWIMRKVFVYLLMVVVILPSIGLTTLRGLLEMIIHSKEKDAEEVNLRWSCIFLPDNGAFFVNYTITSALCGTALELLRFSELFMYALRLLLARSVAETNNVRRHTVYEFPFGFNYGWMMLIFALTSAYAVICPLITPCGLFYLIMKHGVDRYNIFFAYKRSKISRSIHTTAVYFVVVSLLLQQLVLLFFNLIRAPPLDDGKLNPRVLLSALFLALFTLVFVGQVAFKVFKVISPVNIGNNIGAATNNSNSVGNDNEPVVLDDVSVGQLDAMTFGMKRQQRQQIYLPEVLRMPTSNPNASIPLMLTERNPLVNNSNGNNNGNNFGVEDNSSSGYGFNGDYGATSPTK